MKLILREDVYNLGNSGEVVNVKDGYARNYLLPRNLAMLASAANIRQLEHEKKVIELRQQKLKGTAQEQAKKLEGVKVTIKRKVGFDNCAYQYNLALQACPARRLDKLLTAASQKHKSWCTFKAAAGRTWCKTKALSFNAANRNAGFIACDNAYNLNVAQCAQRRLMKDFEKAIQSGNAHEGWCEFKNRSQWLWCKATKAINLNTQARTAALAQCDANYNAGNAACQNAKLLAAAPNSVNVNGYTIAPGN